MKARVVYSSERGQLCPSCGWPANDCRCSRSLRLTDKPLPARISVRLRIENRAAGKTVTVIEGLPKSAAHVRDLARELKKACGTGGSTGEDCVELQGDQRERLRELLVKKGWTVKG